MECLCQSEEFKDVSAKARRKIHTTATGRNIRMDFNRAEIIRPLATPLPYDPRMGSSIRISTPLLAEPIS